MTARPPSPRAWRWSALARAGRRLRGVPTGSGTGGPWLFADDHFLIRAYANHATLLPCTLKAN